MNCQTGEKPEKIIRGSNQLLSRVHHDHSSWVRWFVFTEVLMSLQLFCPHPQGPFSQRPDVTTSTLCFNENLSPGTHKRTRKCFRIWLTCLINWAIWHINEKCGLAYKTWQLNGENKHTKQILFHVMLQLNFKLIIFKCFTY